MARELTFTSRIVWTGNKGSGTSGSKDYTRDFAVRPEGKPEIAGTTAPAFGGDPGRYDPEDMLVSALSSCHMLWYLHLASEAGVVVTSYEDAPMGTMPLGRGGAGQFSEVVLRPRIAITAASDAEKARALHEKAHEMCYIARSVNFPVRCEPEIIAA